MLDVTFPLDSRNNVDPPGLRRLRKEARTRGFRILRGHPGWSLIDSRIEPQRALRGLSDTTYAQIEAALATPPRPMRAYRRKRASGLVQIANALRDFEALQAGGVS